LKTVAYLIIGIICDTIQKEKSKIEETEMNIKGRIYSEKKKLKAYLKKAKHSHDKYKIIWLCT